uniref:Uncharacterized protein n=1 Tax=Arundo donax TaxID=35708 RepID=A0A0A9GWQ4_ARUDO
MLTCFMSITYLHAAVVCILIFSKRISVQKYLMPKR